MCPYFTVICVWDDVLGSVNSWLCTDHNSYIFWYYCPRILNLAYKQYSLILSPIFLLHCIFAILCLLVLLAIPHHLPQQRKHNDFLYSFLACQQHHQSIQSDPPTCAWHKPIFQGFHKILISWCVLPLCSWII